MAIGTTAAIIGASLIGVGGAALGASKAASASKRAAATQAGAQMEQLEYLREREAVPQAYREQAIQQLGGLYGLPGVEGAVPGVGREAFIAGLREDPFYQEQVRAGEESVLRGAAATGGLRAGGTSAALARVSPEILRGIYQERVGGLTGLAGMPSMAPQITGVMGGIGQTQAAGQLAAAQAQQAGIQGATTALGTGVGQYLQYQDLQPQVQPQIQPLGGI